MPSQSRATARFRRRTTVRNQDRTALRLQDRRTVRNQAPTHVTMAPIAGPGASLATAPRWQRRAWLQAAATTGVLLISPQAVGAAPLLTELPGVEASDVERDPHALPLGPWDGIVDAWAVPAAAGMSTGVGGPWSADVRTASARDDDPDALPEGVSEFASYGDVTLVTEEAGLELIGFHEAADPAALELSPTGEAVEAQRDEDLGPLLTLPTRNRATPATSAVDLAIRADEPVVAPVTGEVVQVAEFALYGTTRDVVVEIRPDDDPDIVVKMVHVEGPSVAVGDRVEAGTSEIAAAARQLPFSSQIDAFTAVHRGEAAPHVHIELRYEPRTV